MPPFGVPVGTGAEGTMPTSLEELRARRRERAEATAARARLRGWRCWLAVCLACDSVTAYTTRAPGLPALPERCRCGWALRWTDGPTVPRPTFRDWERSNAALLAAPDSGENRRTNTAKPRENTSGGGTEA